MALAKDITVTLDGLGLVSITPSDIDNGSNDACGVTLSIDMENFTCAEKGANTVILTATDVNGNVSSTTSIVTVIGDPLSSVLTTSDYNGYEVSCNAGSDGEIDLAIAGGIAPYSYTWSNGSSSEDLTGLSIGTYTVEVEDVNTWYTTATITLVEPTAVVSSITSPTVIGDYNTSCTIDGDGSLSIVANGGVAPYQVAWNTGDSDFELEDLIAGVYTVLVTDENGCESIDSIELTKPENCNCYPAFVVPTDFTCTTVLDGKKNANINHGEVACVMSSFSGNLNMNGGSLIIYGDADLNWLNVPHNGEVVVLGSLNASGLNLNGSSSTFKNYGNVTVDGWMNSNGLIENYGVVLGKSGMNVNQSGMLINKGHLELRRSVHNNNVLENYAYLSIGGDFSANSRATFINECTFEAGSRVQINQSVDFRNGGTVTVSEITFNNSDAELSSGSILYADRFTSNQTDFTNSGSSCALVNVEGRTQFNNGSLSGSLFLCDANGVEVANHVSFSNGAAFDCSTCNYSGSAIGSSVRVAYDDEFAVEEELLVSVSPNPASDFVSVETEGEFNIEIYNVNQQVVLQVANVDSVAVLDVAHLPNGLYFVKVVAENGEAAIVKLNID